MWYAPTQLLHFIQRSYTVGSAIGSSPAVANGVVYVGSVDTKVYALNASTGALIWSYATGNAVYCSPTVANGVVYIGSYDHKIYALNAGTGALKWSYTTGNSVYNSAPAVANGMVYVGSYDDKIYALNAASAPWCGATRPAPESVPRPRWRMGWFMSAPTIARFTP